MMRNASEKVKAQKCALPLDERIGYGSVNLNKSHWLDPVAF